MDKGTDPQRFGALPNARPEGKLELELRCLVRYFRAIRHELTARTKLTWKQRLIAWKSGFSAHAWHVYNLDENDPELYLPDIRAVRSMYKVNGFFNPIIGNKLVLSRLLDTHRIPHPKVVSQILGGRLLEEDAPYEPDLWRALSRTLDRFPRQVFRPTWSGGGEGVFFLSREDGVLQLNGEMVTREEACAVLSRLDRYLSTHFENQAAYARAIYPGSTNTLRIVTLWDAENGGAFVAAATHRFGSARSGLIDNFHGGYGGVCAAVDIEIATLGKSVTLDKAGELQRVSHHPDTGEPIEGVAIPGFQLCIETVLEAANHFPFCPWIGWDVVITEAGVSVLEANTLPAFTVSQVHTPFLKDPRTRRVFQRWGLAR